MFCSHCGTSNAVEARFCSSCGGALTQGAQTTAAPIVAPKKKAGVNWWALLLLLVAVFYFAPKLFGHSSPISTIAPQADCSASDFSISKLNGTVLDGGYLKVTGIVTNHCSVAQGVQFHFTIKNNNGDVLSATDPWPASVSNIAPNRPYTFELMEPVSEESVKFTVQPVKTQRW
jgi:hypothetical protein